MSYVCDTLCAARSHYPLIPAGEKNIELDFTSLKRVLFGTFTLLKQHFSLSTAQPLAQSQIPTSRNRFFTAGLVEDANDVTETSSLFFVVFEIFEAHPSRHFASFHNEL